MGLPRALRLALALTLLLPAAAAEGCLADGDAACPAVDHSMLQKGALPGKARSAVVAAESLGGEPPDQEHGGWQRVVLAPAGAADGGGRGPGREPYREPPELDPLDGRASAQLLETDHPAAAGLLGQGRGASWTAGQTTRNASVGIVIILAVCCPISFYCCLAAAAVNMRQVAAEGMSVDAMRNDRARRVRETFDLECPEDERARYCRQEFRHECDKIFDSADASKGGVLDLSELKVPVATYLDGEVVLPQFFTRASEKSEDDRISRDEFFELMKYVRFKRDQKVGW